METKGERMPRLSMNEVTTYRWSFEQDVRSFKSAGFDGIGVWRQKLSDFGEEAGVSLLAELGLDVACLSWVGGFTGSDGRSHQDSIDDALGALRLAASMNASTLLVYTGSREGHTHSHARRLVVTALRELAMAADDFDISLAIEPMHEGCANEWTFLTSARAAFDLIQEIGGSRLKIAFDAYHLAHDPQVLEELPELVSEIAIVQLGDARQAPAGEQNRCRLGEGELPLRELVSILDHAGYAGFYDVELIGEEIELADYHGLLGQSHQAFHELFTVRG